MEKILRFVNLVGGHVPWSNAQRKALGSHFDADARHFGSGCFFYSAAPDDVTHALAQRMCFAHDGSGRFPAVTSVEFESAIRGKSSREQVVGSFDMRSDAMQARIELNPVASVVCFRSQLQLLNKVLGCRSLGRSTGDVRDALRDDRTQPGGFAGALYANRAVIETNQRGCQHTHGILHSAAVMAPDGLSSIVSNRLLCHRLQQNLNKCLMCEIIHVGCACGSGTSADEKDRQVPRQERSSPIVKGEPVS